MRSAPVRKGWALAGSGSGRDAGGVVDTREPQANAKSAAIATKIFKFTSKLF
jgi:hypothetical protein